MTTTSDRDVHAARVIALYIEHLARNQQGSYHEIEWPDLDHSITGPRVDRILLNAVTSQRIAVEVTRFRWPSKEPSEATVHTALHALAEMTSAQLASTDVGEFILGGDLVKMRATGLLSAKRRRSCASSIAQEIRSIADVLPPLRSAPAAALPGATITRGTNTGPGGLTVGTTWTANEYPGAFHELEDLIDATATKFQQHPDAGHVLIVDIQMGALDIVEPALQVPELIDDLLFFHNYSDGHEFRPYDRAATWPDGLHFDRDTGAVTTPVLILDPVQESDP